MLNVLGFYILWSYRSFGKVILLIQNEDEKVTIICLNL